MAWSDTAGKKGDGSQGDGKHLFIKPNQTVKVHVLLNPGEEPISYWKHFIRGKEGGGKSVICPGREVCPACIKGIKGKRSHAVNVWDYDSNSVRIIEQGNSVMQQLKLIFDQYGSLDTVDISIRRVGEGLNTQYLVMPFPLTAPFVLPSGEKFDLETLKMPDSIEKINAVLMGEVTGTVARVGPQKVTQSTSPTPTSDGSQALGFGKYKGKTFEQVAQEDMNYVKWCAQNLNDMGIRAEAQKVVDKLVHTAIDTADTNPEIAHKADMLNKCYVLINTDPRYKGNMNVVIGKMKEATADATNPNGKMLLQEYTLTELIALHTSLMKEEA